MGRPVPIQAPGAPLFLEELMEDEKIIEKTPNVFFIHNTVRSRHNRTQRAQAPTHRGMKQHIGGTHRVIRGRALALTEDLLRLHLEEIKTKQEQGLIVVKTGDGRLVDLRTLAPVAALPVSEPLPVPVLDSIQNDKPAGENRPQLAGGLAENAVIDENATPSLLAGLNEDEPEDTMFEPEEFHGGENTELGSPPGEFLTEPADHAQARTGKKGKKDRR